MTMASVLDEILIEDEKERYADLKLYKRNNDALKGIFLREIPFPVLKRIAIILHGTMSEDEWMAFLCELGIKDNVFITWIKLKAKYSEEPPIYLALKGPLQHIKSFGEVIDILMAKERYDVLYDIKPFIEGLLEKSMDPDLKHLPVSDAIQPTAPAYHDIASQKAKILLANSNDCSLERNKLQQRELIDPVYGKSIVKNIDDSNKIVKRKLISVLLLHSEVDYAVAKNLASLLSNEGIIVRMLSDLDYLLLMNSVDTIHALLCAVDFVVPIVSESFLREIHPEASMHMAVNSQSWDEENLSNTSNNHYIYQLMLDEYIKNKCLNFRVRPVTVPEMKKRLPKYDILLTCSLKLWEAVPKFVEILKKTKLILTN